MSSGTLSVNTAANSVFSLGRVLGSLGDIRRLDGMVDEVSVYNRTLTPAEIWSIYQAGPDGKIKSMAVVGSSPADGETVAVPPTDFTLDFSLPYDPATVQADDLTVNGVPANSFTLTDPETITFHYVTSPVVSSGLQSMNMAAGAVSQANTNVPVTAFNADFVYQPPAPYLQFGTATSSIGEGDGSVTILVSRTGKTEDAVSVQYATSDGTATAGTDFSAVFGTLMFAANETSKTFTVPIQDDTLAEGDETFSVTLSNPGGGGTLGSPSAAVVTIREDDVAGTVQFGSATYSVSEDGGLATITVTRTGGSASGVTVRYATSNGTASAGSGLHGCLRDADVRRQRDQQDHHRSHPGRHPDGGR